MSAQPGKTVEEAVPKGGLGKIVDYLSKVVDPLTSKVGVSIAAVMMALMMFLTFFDVAGRFLLNKPINGSLEITEYMMGVMVAFALGYTAFRKGHIRVDIILQYASRRVVQWMDIFAYGISMIFYCFIAWQSWLNAVSVMESKLTSAVLLVPAYPFVFIVAIGAAFVVLIFLRDFLNAIAEVSR